MRLQEAWERHLARQRWHRRLLLRFWNAWYGIEDWLKDRWYGAPWEEQKRLANIRRIARLNKRRGGVPSPEDP